jgi:hypothetical protein
LEPEGFGGDFKGSSEGLCKKGQRKAKQKIKLLVTTVERMVDKKVGL